MTRACRLTPAPRCDFWTKHATATGMRRQLTASDMHCLSHTPPAQPYTCYRYKQAFKHNGASAYSDTTQETCLHAQAAQVISQGRASCQWITATKVKGPKQRCLSA